MKKLFIVSLIVLMVLGVLSCGSGGIDESCSQGTTCNKTGTAWEACCTTTQCRYLVGGRSFECNGTDCNAAAKQLVAYCMGNAADLEKILKSVQQTIIADEGCTDNR